MAGRDRSADAACRYQRGPTMFARIGVVNALNRGHVREFNTSRTDSSLGTPENEEDEL
jgi:hypothetical protein